MTPLSPSRGPTGPAGRRSAEPPGPEPAGLSQGQRPSSELDLHEEVLGVHQDLGQRLLGQASAHEPAKEARGLRLLLKLLRLGVRLVTGREHALEGPEDRVLALPPVSSPARACRGAQTAGGLREEHAHHRLAAEVRLPGVLLPQLPVALDAGLDALGEARRRVAELDLLAVLVVHLLPRAAGE